MSPRPDSPATAVAARPSLARCSSLSDELRPFYGCLPCERCDRIPPDCPCIRGEIPLRRARAHVNRRHRASVKAAAVSARLDRRRAA